MTTDRMGSQPKLTGKEAWLNLFLWVPISLGLTLGILLSSLGK